MHMHVFYHGNIIYPMYKQKCAED
uniref:Uncharacterized protein n=1 Tax=Anguilla anguilla TaxID=7936 RepID=A0A0E9VXL6_ANGAN